MQLTERSWPGRFARERSAVQNIEGVFCTAPTSAGCRSHDPGQSFAPALTPCRHALQPQGASSGTGAIPGDAVIKKSDGPHAVSANNPCPFLRALVATGKLADDREPLAKVAAVVAATARAGDGRPVLPRTAVFAIASVANGWGPLSLVSTQWHGLQLNALRGGPLDKKGVGSRILDARGAVDAKEWRGCGALPRRSPTPMDRRNWAWGWPTCAPTWTPTLRAPQDAGARSTGR